MDSEERFRQNRLENSDKSNYSPLTVMSLVRDGMGHVQKPHWEHIKVNFMILSLSCLFILCVQVCKCVTYCILTGTQVDQPLSFSRHQISLTHTLLAF